MFSASAKICTVVLLAVTISCSLKVRAEDVNSGSWSGYLVDARTAAKEKDLVSPLMHISEKYTKSEALSAGARAAGYELYSEGKWFKLDSGGSTKAREILEKTIRRRGFYVLVQGCLTNGEIKTKRVTELVGAPVRQPHSVPPH